MSDLFFRNPRLLTLSILLILVAGLAGFQSLPRLEDPELTQRFARITTRFPGATAERVEALVTDKLEEELFEIVESVDVLVEEVAGRLVEPVGVPWRAGVQVALDGLRVAPARVPRIGEAVTHQGSEVRERLAPSIVHVGVARQCSSDFEVVLSAPFPPHSVGELRVDQPQHRVDAQHVPPHPLELLVGLVLGVVARERERREWFAGKETPEQNRAALLHNVPILVLHRHSVLDHPEI